MEQQACKWEDGYIPTFEEIAENKRMVEICQFYNIRIGCLSDKNLLTSDEIQALNYILHHKNIPTALRNRLLHTKHQRVIPQSTNTEQMTEDEAFELFGIQRP